MSSSKSVIAGPCHTQSATHNPAVHHGVICKICVIDAIPGRRPALSRVFTEQTGLPPGRYVERSRADAARRLLEVTGHPLDRVARESGLGAAETLYRVFRRHWRISPGDYRRWFQAKES